MSILKNKFHVSYRVAFYIWAVSMIALTISSLLPPGNEPSYVDMINDKIRHFSAYAILSLIACHAGRNWRERIILCLIGFILSVGIEFLQPLTDRNFNVLDIVANMSGTLVGMGIMTLLLRRRASRQLSRQT